MKKYRINTKSRFILFLSLITIIGILWSCEEEGIKQFWNDNEPADITAITPQGAFVGSEVTISGEYFSPKADNSVSFGGMDATIIHANLTEITVIIPGVTPGATVDVIVTSDGEPSNSLSYTTGIPVIPVLTSLDPSSGKVGSSVVITGTNFGSAVSDNVVKFNGAEAVVTNVTATTVTATVPAGATTGEVTVTVDGESNGLQFTVVESLTLTVQITDGIDDVEEASSTGIIDWESSDLELGEYDTTGDPDYGLQTIGLRFRNITIPPGATILSATIQFTCDVGGAGEAQMTIYGEDVPDSAPFDPLLQYTVTGRAKTTANSVWDIPEWLNRGDAGAAQRTSELAAVVQAIIDRGDWTSGNSMAFIMEHSGPSIGVTSSSAGREAETVEGHNDGADAAVLVIVYDE